MRTKSLVLPLTAALVAISFAQDERGAVYRFGAHEKHTNITFVSEADIENIYGITHTATGRTWLDFEGLKGRCNISVPVASMKTGIDLRDEHMRSETWLDAAKHPEITLTSDGFDLVEKNKDKGIYEAKFKGKLTIHGVTKDLDTTAKVVKIGEDAAKRMGGGDWVRVTAGFTVAIKEFGIVIPAGDVVAKVSPEWTVKFDCYAGTNAK